MAQLPHDRYEWVNGELFKRILRPDDVRNIHVKEIRKELAVANGENYSSVLFRVHVNYSIENINQSKVFVIKVRGNLKRTQDCFQKEIHIYDQIIPKFENLWEEKGKPYKFAPKSLGSNLSEVDVNKSYLALEDLAILNYKNHDRKVGLNFDQLRKTLNVIAKWHASSVKVVENNSEKQQYELYMRPHICPDGSKHYRTLFEYSVKHCAKMLKDRNPELSKKLDKLEYVVYEQTCDSVKRSSEESFNVLNHGDLWCNNVMFNNNSPENNRPLLVDYQMSYYGSPALDTSYLLFTSANVEVSPENYDELFDHYSNELINAMKELNIDDKKIPSNEQLKQEMNERGCYGAYYSLFIVPMRMLETDQTDNVLRYLDPSEDDFRTKAYSPENVVHRLEKLLKIYDSKGWLDVKEKNAKLFE